MLAEAIARLRAGEVIRDAGYDGEYGVIRLFEPDELRRRTAGGMLFECRRRSRARRAGGRASRVPPVERLRRTARPRTAHRPAAGTRRPHKPGEPTSPQRRASARPLDRPRRRSAGGGVRASTARC